MGKGPEKPESRGVETGLAASRQACLALIAGARNQLELLSRDLDPPLFDDADLVEAVRAFVLRHRHNRMLILLQESERARKEGHRLVTLAQRLPTRIEIRRPAPEYSVRSDDFLVADARGVVVLKRQGHLETEVDLHNPLEAGTLHALFQELWERGSPDTDLRRLGI